MNGKILILDTETTGFEDDDRVIQIGSVMLSKNKIYTSEDFVKTSRKISIGSMTAHGIRTLPKNAKHLNQTSTMKRINSLTENDIIVGHNIDFDLNMIRNVTTNDKFKVVDTMLIAEFMKSVGMLGKEDKISLQYLRYKWVSQKRENELIKKHKPNGGAHSALFDSLITVEILAVMVDEIANYYLDKPDTVWGFLQSIYEDRFAPEIVTIPIGKYKDKTVIEVYNIDYKYLEWFYDNITGCDRQKTAIMNLSNQLKNKEN